MGIADHHIVPLYQVDAFSENVFEGNPAAICVLNQALDVTSMQLIAAENNLAETAFVRLDTQPYELRWFTPTTEVALCGHATLASAHVLFNEGLVTADRIDFQSLQSGVLSVKREAENNYTLDFPADRLESYALKNAQMEAIGAPVIDAAKGQTDLILRVDSPKSVALASPDLVAIKSWPFRGVIVTAKGEGEVDFVSRFFGPAVGVDEDPVTGSAHTSLTVYWAERLKKSKLSAYQVSKRGGSLICELDGDRVKLTGNARLYLKGEIYVPYRKK